MTTTELRDKVEIMFVNAIAIGDLDNFALTRQTRYEALKEIGDIFVEIADAIDNNQIKCVGDNNNN